MDLGSRKADIVEIAFQDSGVGIPKEHLEKIFLPFFTTKRRGSGLGLASVHRIVDLHGGWIKVDSREHEGTNVIVCLPQPADAGVRFWCERREPWKRF